MLESCTTPPWATRDQGEERGRDRREEEERRDKGSEERGGIKGERRGGIKGGEERRKGNNQGVELRIT